MIGFEKNFGEAIEKLDERIKACLKKIRLEEQTEIQEIRIRCKRPIMVRYRSKNIYVYKDGKLGDKRQGDVYIVGKDEIKKSVERLCEYSMYAYQGEIKQGYITLKGGHRVGLVGTAVMKGKEIENIKDIKTLNIRIARRKIGVADKIIAEMMEDGLKGMLICGKPGSGKTTMIKDIIRQISSGCLGKFYNVSVIDERGEIMSGCEDDEIEREQGCCVDVYDGFMKAQGMMMAIRTMAPDVIVCDEIGDKEEIKEIESALNAGIKVIVTVHASSQEEVYRKVQIKRLIDIKAFDKLVILGSESEVCKIEKIISIV